MYGYFVIMSLKSLNSSGSYRSFHYFLRFNLENVLNIKINFYSVWK